MRERIDRNMFIQKKILITARLPLCNQNTVNQTEPRVGHVAVGLCVVRSMIRTAVSLYRICTLDQTNACYGEIRQMNIQIKRTEKISYLSCNSLRPLFAPCMFDVSSMRPIILLFILAVNCSILIYMSSREFTIY